LIAKEQGGGQVKRITIALRENSRDKEDSGKLT
jgi:hypothetical protein